MSLPERLLNAAPMLSTYLPARRRWQPELCGITAKRHVALTFDDGPDPASTPQFLRLLAQYDVRATFFLLGAWVEPHADLVKEMAAAGHELAIHGWSHRATPFLRPDHLRTDLARAVDVVRTVSGQDLRWYRPPYGVLTRSARDAAHSAGLTPVLWSAWGRDWELHATPERVVKTVTRRAEPGGTVLLHDTDRTSAPGSWRTTLAATEILLNQWRSRGWTVGHLSQSETTPAPGPVAREVQAAQPTPAPSGLDGR